MGFFDSIVGALTGKNPCPACGTPGGSSGPSGSFRCLNPLCKNFDPTLMGGVASQPPASSSGASSSAPAASAPPPAASGWRTQTSGTPPAPPSASGGGTVQIRYLNHAGETKVFTADVGSLHRIKEHIQARVQPKRATITLARKRIQNLAEVEALMPARVAPGQEWPSSRERQVLSFHKKHQSTSPLYEKVRAKYPNW